MKRKLAQTAASGLSAKKINVSAIKGEPGTGFEKRGDKGPFQCSNCEYFMCKSCWQKDMKRMSRQPRLPDGTVKVSAEDCCEYVTRIGK